jgi:copper(I)-binding protein
MRIRFPRALGVVLLLCAVMGTPVVAGDIEALQAWSRATPPGTTVGVGYLTLRNVGAQPRVLQSASSPVAAGVEFHETRRGDQGLSQMRPLGDLSIAAGSTLRFEPNGRHLMLVGLKAPLVAGQRVPLTLRFAGEAPLEIELAVQPLTAIGPPAGAHHGH